MSSGANALRVSRRWIISASSSFFRKPWIGRGGCCVSSQIQWYRTGQAVPQDYATAARWYRKAAEQGDSLAQLSLGGMYFYGDGVPQDYVLAHMWFNLGAAGGEKKAAELRDMLAKQMTPAQIAEAQKLAREWKPK
jgi:TPR repeat protein